MKVQKYNISFDYMDGSNCHYESVAMLTKEQAEALQNLLEAEESRSGFCGNIYVYPREPQQSLSYAEELAELVDALGLDSDDYQADDADDVRVLKAISEAENLKGK